MGHDRDLQIYSGLGGRCRLGLQVIVLHQLLFYNPNLYKTANLRLQHIIVFRFNVSISKV